MAAFVTDNFEDSTSSGSVRVLPEVHALKEEIFSNRRWFHQHPELSFEEKETAAKCASLLRSYGIPEVFEGIGRTGVVAVLRGSSPGPCIALRADMDALPLPETADISYKSVNEGVMHACGHDGHMAALLAVAKILASDPSKIKGTVKFFLQPAEERYGGATEMIKDGCLEDGKLGPRVDAVYGVHLWTPVPLGEVRCSDGPVMAATDVFELDVKGKGGHGAMPHSATDAIVTAANLVTSLQTIVSRNTDPLQSGVVTCGTINGGYAHNIIADKVRIRGTARSFTPQVQDTIKSRMGQMCCGLAHCYGGNIDMNYIHGYPATVNAYPECTKLVREISSDIVGAERSSGVQKTMGAEDFSYFLQERPGAFIFVGAALPGEPRPHHKSVFDFDERAMLISASVLLGIVQKLLG